MIFHTRSGSIYELDTSTKRARRLHGSSESVRLTEDWRAYEDAFVEVGKTAWINWTSETPALTELGGMPATVTSIVMKVEGGTNEQN